MGDLQNAAGTCKTMRNLQNAGIQACVGTAADVAFGEKSLEEALKGGGIQFTSQFVGSTASNKIGDHFKGKQDTTDRILHKVVHGVAGGGLAAGLAAVTNQDIGATAAAGAAGAMTAEIVAEILSKPLNEELYKEVQEQQSELGRELSHNEKHALFLEKLESIAL